MTWFNFKLLRAYPKKANFPPLFTLYVVANAARLFRVIRFYIYIILEEWVDFFWCGWGNISKVLTQTEMGFPTSLGWERFRIREPVLMDARQ